MHLIPVAHPVFSLERAKRFEAAYFGDNTEAEWVAMNRAGNALAEGIVADWAELAGWPRSARLLVLAGKGHNGGDAMLAAKGLLQRYPDATAELVLPFGESAFRPLGLRAYQELTHCGGNRVTRRSHRQPLSGGYDVSIDGVFGFQFHPPLPPVCSTLFAALNQAKIRLRAAVDLPSGLGEKDAVRADFTYATGSVKTPVLDGSHRGTVGRLRYLDLGFFDQEEERGEEKIRVLTDQTLDFLRGWRAPFSDKRDYGHLFVIGGSRRYPGAVMMSVRAALLAGVGLLTAFVPETLVASYAAHLPEAMWVGCPETSAGGLALEGLHLVKERASRATALTMGPGMGQEPETAAFAADCLAMLGLPAVLDADALQAEILARNAAPRVVTPHAGEFKRLAGETRLAEYAKKSGAIAVLKGAPTRISDGEFEYLSLGGGPVLARGGSGDILAGMIGGLLAQQPKAALRAACSGVLWHGLAADALARTYGPTAVHTLQLLDFLPRVLRREGPQ